MLRKISDLRGVDLYATDGELGKVIEFYFDDRDWTVLYMVVDSGAWLPGRRVLVPPATLGEVDWVEGNASVMVTRDEIESSPEIDLHGPIAREQEVAYFGHFGWACLWSGELRSTQEVTGNQIVANAGEIAGTVKDLIVDELWTVRYLILNEQGSDRGREILFSPKWIEESDWAGLKMSASSSAESIRSAPTYNLAQIIKREYEEELHKHYGQTPYWE